MKVAKTKISSADKYTPGVPVQRTINCHLNPRRSAKGGNGIVIVRHEATSRTSTIEAAVTMVQGQATNKLVPQPRPGGYAGIMFGVSVTSADVTSAATVTGYGVVVALADGKQVRS